MRILIVTPASRGDRTGNRITALRWAAQLESAGHRVRIAEAYQDQPCDALLAIHAGKSHPSVVRFRDRRPSRPLIVALAGTDVYGELDPATLRSLELADRIITLQPRAILRLDPKLRPKARAIFQSATPMERRPTGELTIAVVGHLRQVKDPFRAAEAARLLPASSRIQVVQAGAATSAEFEERAQREARENPRYRWLGAVSRKEVRSLLSRSAAMVISSWTEGGANVVCEAIATRVPILASKIEGTLGQLGEDYRGWFTAGDTGELAELMLRFETDAELSSLLDRQVARLAPLFTVQRERQLLGSLIEELQDGGGSLRRSDRFRVVEVEGPRSSFREDVAFGLDAAEKHLHCRYFYDDSGSKLFQEICELEEYYLPRAEREILEAHRHEVVALAPVDAAIVELGSGDGAKTRLLLEAFHARYGRVRYTPVDIDTAMLEQSAQALLADIGGLTVAGIAGEYGSAFAHLESTIAGLPKLLLFLGSSIGNFDRAEAAAFLARFSRVMGPQDLMLVGIDLRKDPAILNPAYDDPKGVTARFNLNLLARINRELKGDFDLDAFAHRAWYQEQEGRVVMYLESRVDQTVSLEALQMKVPFRAGERIHTEWSYKYSMEEIDQLALQAGLRLVRRWTDTQKLFCTVLLAR